MYDTLIIKISVLYVMELAYHTLILTYYTLIQENATSLFSKMQSTTSTSSSASTAVSIISNEIPVPASDITVPAETPSICPRCFIPYVDFFRFKTSYFEENHPAERIPASWAKHCRSDGCKGFSTKHLPVQTCPYCSITKQNMQQYTMTQHLVSM